MLRVDSSSVLVVPPFECAWLLDEQRQLRDNACCVTFEAKGDNDVTLILKPKPGSRRWQHMELQDAQAGMRVDRNYTIIFGSHRNSCLRIEKDAQECYRAERGACISASRFVTCWVNFDNGKIQLGFGSPGSAPAYCWADASPIAGIQHIGLGSWDAHVCFRNIRVLPPLTRRPVAAEAQPDGRDSAPASSVPPLAALCQRAVREAAGPASVCAALALVELLSPQLDSVAAPLLGLLAARLPAVLAADPAGFQALPALMLAELLGHPYLDCPERLLFDALALWAFGGACPPPDAELQQCLADVEALLLRVRFPLMPPADLQALEQHPLAQHSALLPQLLAEAAQARMHGDAAHQPRERLAVEGRRLVVGAPACRPQLPGGGFPRRHPPASQHLMFVAMGDANGVAHWLGTCYGRQAWMNPVLAGMLQVSASSPSCKQTDPKALAGRSLLRLNQAGPGRGGTWWQLDLGPRHRLVCNYYTMRQDASADFPRDWCLQASNDGQGWVELRRHEADAAICLPQQCCAWPVTGHAAALPYRMFRLLLRPPTGAARAAFHLSQLELYGHFFRLE